MREIFTSGTVGGALGNRCFYPEISSSLSLFLQEIPTKMVVFRIESGLAYS